MAKALIGTNTKVEVQKTLSSAITVTGVTKASPGVATYSGTDDLTTGDVVVFSVTGGMVELDGQAVRVGTVDTGGNTFQLEGLDTTDYSTWTEGSAYEVTAWETLDSAQNVTMPNPTPNKLDCTTLIDKQKQYVFGLPDAPDGSITGLFNPAGAAEQLIFAATRQNETMVFRLNWADGRATIFNGYVSGGQGFDMGTNQVATQTISFTPKRDVMHYAAT